MSEVVCSSCSLGAAFRLCAHFVLQVYQVSEIVTAEASLLVCERLVITIVIVIVVLFVMTSTIGFFNKWRMAGTHVVDSRPSIFDFEESLL